MTTLGVDGDRADEDSAADDSTAADDADGLHGVTVLLIQLVRMVYRRAPESVLGMRLKEFAALSHLSEHGAAGQQAMGEAMCMDPNSLVLLLNDLEAAGQAVRRRDPADRRRHIVDITPDGRAAVRRAERGLDSIEDDVLAALRPDDRATLRALLVQALDNPPGASRG